MPLKPAIRIENLSKQYRLGTAQKSPYRTLRESLTDTATATLRKIKSRLSSSRDDSAGNEDFWALRDVSFDVQPGEVVGIIGRNGAGKSTLLKILSRITEPTSGRAVLRGRVASLLEVGTGFHPELSGRENIYLNGGILGMKRREIRRKFDEIVDFSGVEQFLDTPVKRYSSGMYVRLAFAVSAHVDPDILIIDEVLAVGDAEFQKKCLGKMQDVAQDGRTVLFVSHNMAAVQKLCTRAVFLQKGEVAFDGDVQKCIRSYLGEGRREFGDGTADLSRSSVNRRGIGDARFTLIELKGLDGHPTSTFQFAQPMRVCLTAEAKVPIKEAILGFSYIASDGTEVLGTSVHDGGIECQLHRGTNRFECVINPMVLTPGTYSIRASIFKPPVVYDHINDLISFRVDSSRSCVGDGPRNHYVGYVYLSYIWNQVKDR